MNAYVYASVSILLAGLLTVTGYRYGFSSFSAASFRWLSVCGRMANCVARRFQFRLAGQKC